MSTDFSTRNTAFGKLPDRERIIVDLLLDVLLNHPCSSAKVVNRIYRQLAVELGKKKPSYDKIAAAFSKEILPR